MPINAGTRLGVYEIVAPLGAGGMGEVYRARDTRLARSVAIKVLPDALAQDEERIARFEREAKSLAALNHPHIATLLGLDEVDGRHLLVMELVEGETLAERLARGPLPIGETLRIAGQLAEALEAAHEKGIVHRDLKPANIKLTPDDQVKVLDFGLAKALESSPEHANFSHSPTLSVMATGAGVILGTAAYMSPEQAKGHPADQRSDVFSFGCVLYEMITRQQAFQGETVADILASVLAREPDYSVIPADINPRLVTLLKRTLEKQRKQRWQAIGDLRVEIAAIAASPHAGRETAAATARPAWRLALSIALVTALVVGIAAFAVGLRLRPAAAVASPQRFVLRIGGVVLTNPNRAALGISPDGLTMAFSVDGKLFIKTADDATPRLLPNTDGLIAVNHPVFSPDSQVIAFWAGADSTIRRIPVSGGPPFTICTTIGQPMGVTWSGDSILFSEGAEIKRVSANGGTPQVVARVDEGEVAYGPQMLPDGDTILMTVNRGRWTEAPLVAYSMSSGKRTTLIERGNDGRYLNTGHLLFAREGVLYAVRFDPRQLKTSGEPVPIVQGVRRAVVGATPVAHFVVADSGTLVYAPGQVTSGSERLQLALFDQKGNATPLKMASGAYAEPRMSPDGKAIVYAHVDNAQTSLWISDSAGAAAPRRLTFGGRNRYAEFSPDGQRIAFQTDREGDLGIFVMRADGSGVPQRLTTPTKGTAHVPEHWSKDGTLLFFDEIAGATHTLHVYSFNDRTSRPIADTRTDIPPGAMLSPNGRWLMYSWREKGGRATVFLQPFPPTGAKYQISKNTEDGHHAMWSPDGSEVYYTPGPGNRLMRVRVSTSPAFSVSEPDALMRPFTNAPPSDERTYDVGALGHHFLGLQPEQSPDEAASQGAQEFRVVLNWTTELKARVP